MANYIPPKNDSSIRVIPIKNGEILYSTLSREDNFKVGHKTKILNHTDFEVLVTTFSSKHQFSEVVYLNKKDSIEVVHTSLKLIIGKDPAYFNSKNDLSRFPFQRFTKPNLDSKKHYSEQGYFNRSHLITLTESKDSILLINKHFAIVEGKGGIVLDTIYFRKE